MSYEKEGFVFYCGISLDAFCSQKKRDVNCAINVPVTVIPTLFVSLTKRNWQRSCITEHMMTETTDINVPEETRQSKDYQSDFRGKNPPVPIADISISDDSKPANSNHKCLHCEETYENHKKMKKLCSAVWKQISTDDMSSDRNSITSVISSDSGYASRKNTDLEVSEIEDVDFLNKTS
nr:uncharacterized protein LOC565039 isoform X1 [Danio rerio]|eukprot:XP_017212840.1 uncharacterized protein LOC565039 isoform X1 [Danio rerio]